MMLTVGAGEVVSCCILGVGLGKLLQKNKFIWEMSHLKQNQKEINKADMTFNSPKEDCDSGNLVKLTDIDDDFIIELRYATEDNFTGKRSL